MNLNDFNLSTEDKAKLQELIDAEVIGLKNKNSELLGKQSELKQSLQSMSEQLKQFDGLDVTKLKELAANAQSQQEAEMLKNGQLQELIDMKLDAQKQSFGTQIEQLQQEANQHKSNYEKVTQEFNQTQVENFIRSSLSQIKDLHPSAVDDIVFRAQSAWKFQDGQVLAFDGDKQLFKEGKPLSPNDWVESMRESAPHYFNKAVGGNSAGNQGGTGDISRYFDKSNKDYSVTKQAEVAKTNPEQYESLSQKFA